MNWMGIAMLEALVLVIMSLLARYFHHCFTRAVFIASRGYRPMRDTGYGGSYWTWVLPQSEKSRLSELGATPKTLTLEDAYRRAKLEEERETLQLPMEPMLPKEPVRVEWR